MHQLGWSAEPTPVGFAPTMNPVDETLAVGGSSSGSAAAVAAGMAHLALGTDTAGSVRIPAAYCGVVGFKPRVGDVPSDGFLQTTRSFDAIGVLARSVRDCAAAYEAFADRPIPLLDHDKGVSPRIAVLEDLFAPCDQDIVEALRPALEYLGERHTMRPQRVDWQPVGYLRLLAAEFADRWGDTIVPDTELYCPDVIESIAFGKRVAPEHDHLMRRLAEDRVAVAERLSSCDVLVAPVVPHSVPLKGAEPTLGRTIEIVRIFSALDWPAISVPVGVDRSGRPASLQLAAHPDNLQSLFHVALSFDAYEPSCNGTHR
jgi:aspartyl-tRNA(Asn)/glutamyl-tRNA(Gln) amidotransferase subunit A